MAVGKLAVKGRGKNSLPISSLPYYRLTSLSVVPSLVRAILLGTSTFRKPTNQGCHWSGRKWSGRCVDRFDRVDYTATC